MNSSAFEAWYVKPAFVLMLICVLVLPALMTYPFHSDLDIYQSMGVQLNERMGLPYLASWDGNFPGIVAFHALAIALFGNSMLGFRFLELIVQIAIVLSLYRVSRLWLAKESALLGCLFYSLMYVHGPCQFIGQRDCFVVLPLVLFIGCIVLAYRSESSRRKATLLITSGSLIGLASVIRPTFAVMLVVPLLTLFDIRKKGGSTALWYEAIGFCLIVALCVLPYAFVEHGLRELYLGAIRFNMDIYVPAASFDRASNRWIILLGLIVSWIVAVVIHRRSGAHFAETPRSRPEQLFLIGIFVATILEIVSMRRLAGYHQVPLFALFMPVLASVLWEWKGRAGRFGTVILAVLVGVAGLAAYPWGQMASFCHRAPIAIQTKLPDRIYEPGSEDAVCAYIQKHTANSDPVEVAGFIPALRWRLERPWATRFMTPYPLVMTRRDGSFTGYQKQFRAEYVDRIARVQPRYFVIQNFINGPVSTMSLLNDVPGLTALLEQAYVLDTSIGIYYLYKRR